MQNLTFQSGHTANAADYNCHTFCAARNSEKFIRTHIHCGPETKHAQEDVLSHSENLSLAVLCTPFYNLVKIFTPGGTKMLIILCEREMCLFLIVLGNKIIMQPCALALLLKIRRVAAAVPRKQSPVSPFVLGSAHLCRAAFHLSLHSRT